VKIAWLALGTLALCSGQTPDSLARDSLARIEGQVVSVTGAPLPGVSVELRVVDLGFVVWETATTDAKGQFVFDAVEPRAYRISAAPSGYVSTERNDTSSSVTVQRGEKRTGIVLRLIRASSITGRVVDQDRNPIPNPKVSLYRKARLTSHNELRLASPFVTSAADGTFTFADVTPGSYYLGIEKDKITSYYPGVFDPSEAIPVTAIAGSDSGGIEIRLPNPQVFHVRGQVIDQETKAPVNAFVQLSSNATVLNRFAPPASTQAKDGNFQLDVLPGSYTVNAAQTPVPGMPPHVGSEMINVGRSDVDDVIVQLHPAPSVSGKIT
jgi:hypothetical protein